MPRFRGGVISATESSPTFGMWKLNDVTQAVIENTWGVTPGAGGGGGGSVSGIVVEYLIVGSGAGGTGTQGGGGGAGGVLRGSSVVDSSVSYTITVGAGGIGTSGQHPDITGGTGNYSLFNNIIALGGGGGGRFQWDAYSYSRTSADKFGLRSSAGGEGARQGPTAEVYEGNTIVPGQGHVGGSVTGFHTDGTNYPAAGGGGAGGPGINVTTRTLSSQGGPGIYSSISGSNTAYAGGGGGAHFSWNGSGTASNTKSIGGGGRGGARAYNSEIPVYYPNGGSPVSPAGEAGDTNSGSGGGGAPHIGGVALGGNGGSGIVILSYPASSANATSTGSPVYSEANSKRIFTFTGSGSITFN